MGRREKGETIVTLPFSFFLSLSLSLSFPDVLVEEEEEGGPLNGVKFEKPTMGIRDWVLFLVAVGREKKRD